MRKVSVIIPTYKRSDMLCRAVESVLNQTYKEIEVIVVDDNDPDTEWRHNTSQIMERYCGNPRVKYVCHDKNMNGSVARNTGINIADGDLITYLDDDDIYTPEKIEKQVQYLESHPQYRAVYCGWNRENHDFIPEGEGDLSFGILSGTNIIITNSIMMWKDDCINCGAWDISLKRHQEAAYFLNYFRNGGLIGRIDEVLVMFDTTDRTNVSDSKLTEEQLLYLLKKYDDIVQKCEREKSGSRNRIYGCRLLGIVLPYAKNNCYFKAIFKYIFYFLKYPKALLWATSNYIEYRLSKDYSKQSR